MAEAAGRSEKLNIFLSYSREDLAFTDQLYAALEACGFGLTMDRHSIAGGDEWEKRLTALIRDADTVVFVLSPKSAASKYCIWEVQEAVRLGKRILPVLCGALGEVRLPPQLARLNRVFAYPERTLPGSGFGVGLATLLKALKTDLKWLQKHTDYLRQANNWDEGGRPSNRLLFGPDIAAAKAWTARRPKNAPEPTSLQLDFIKASEAEEIRQQSVEAQRRREAEEAADKLRVQLDRANRALADAINNDLLFGAGGRWAPRTCNALWKLAVADEAVKGEYIAILAGNSGEMARAAPGFAQISRALGLLRPSPAEAEKLVAGAIDALSDVKERGNAEPLIAEIIALAPTDAEAGGILDQVLKKIGHTTNVYALRALAKAIQALPVKPTDLQAARALDSLLKQTGETTNAYALWALAEAIQALPVKLTDAQARQILDPILTQIGQTTDGFALDALGLAIQVLATQAGRAFDRVLDQIGETTNPDALGALAQAIPALPAELTAQADRAFDQVLDQIGETINPFAFLKVAQVIKALAAKLTDARASQAFDHIIIKIGETDNPFALWALAEAIGALPVMLTDAQAVQALDPVLKQIGQTTDPFALTSLAGAIQVLPLNLTDAQAGQALDPVLKQIGQTTDPSALTSLAGAIQALAPKLTDGQAHRALDPILKQIAQTDRNALRELAQALQALPVKLTDGQARQALDSVLRQFGQTTDSFPLESLGRAYQALTPKLTETQASQALNPVLKQFGQAVNAYALKALAEALQTLTPKLTDAQAGEALEPVLKQIGQTTDPSALPPLTRALQTLAPKLTEAQAGQTLDPVLKKIGQTTDPTTLQALAQALHALAPKLTETSAREGSSQAKASLAWAASEDEALSWAGALVTLLDRASDPDGTRKLVAAVAYPAAAGKATEALLDAVRAERPDAPAKNKGPQAALEWLAEQYPEILRPPDCPPPPQPYEISGLKCPTAWTASSSACCSATCSGLDLPAARDLVHDRLQSGGGQWQIK